jgi:positive regulator of sigma E activity
MRMTVGFLFMGYLSHFIGIFIEWRNNPEWYNFICILLFIVVCCLLAWLIFRPFSHKSKNKRKKTVLFLNIGLGILITSVISLLNICDKTSSKSEAISSISIIRSWGILFMNPIIIIILEKENIQWQYLILMVSLVTIIVYGIIFRQWEMLLNFVTLSFSFIGVYFSFHHSNKSTIAKYQRLKKVVDQLTNDMISVSEFSFSCYKNSI